jgi:hypothetical protein
MLIPELLASAGSAFPFGITDFCKAVWECEKQGLKVQQLDLWLCHLLALDFSEAALSSVRLR